MTIATYRKADALCKRADAFEKRAERLATAVNVEMLDGLYAKEVLTEAATLFTCAAALRDIALKSESV